MSIFSSKARLNAREYSLEFEEAKSSMTTKQRRLIILGVVIVVTVVVTLLVVFLGNNDDTKASYGLYNDNLFKNAAVTANGVECAAIGRDILLKNGSAADAAIATLFCDGITCGQCMGLGGGFLLAIYTHATGQVKVLNAREVAPIASSETMFEGGNISTTVGGKAVAVPGEIRGYQALHEKYGILPWADLIQPTIDLCKNGYLVTNYLARVLAERKNRILNETSLSEIFIDPSTNDVWKEGDKIKRPVLANTLEIIAREGADALYNGSLTKSFVKDIQEFNGIITEEDMHNYQPQWLDPLTMDLDKDLKLHTIPLPGSGHVLTLILNALKGWVFPQSRFSSPKIDVEENSVVYWHRIVEIFKYAYAKRTGLGDLSFLPIDKIKPLLDNMTSVEYAENLRSLIADNVTYNDWKHYGAEFGILEDHGTAHVSVLAPNGDAVAVTSTINFILGAFIRSRSTGIILNNEMDDFSYADIVNIYGIPSSPTNYPKGGKRPLSSMTPTIVVEKGLGPRFIVGAAGGTKITTQVALVILKHLLSGQPLADAIENPRLHHQLLPMTIQHEFDFDAKLLQELRNIGHNTSGESPTSGFAAFTAISVNHTSGSIEAQLDRRRLGSVAGF